MYLSYLQGETILTAQNHWTGRLLLQGFADDFDVRR